MYHQSRLLDQQHRAVWSALYRAYGVFYQVEIDDAHCKRVWEWIHDEAVSFEAFGAFIGEQLIGFVHYRFFPHSLKGGTSLYIDDLYVDEAHRGKGIGRKLLEVVFEEGEKADCVLARWITAPDNAAAKKVYDACAQKTAWETYDHIL